MWDQVVFSFQTLFASSSNQTWLELALQFFSVVVSGGTVVYFGHCGHGALRAAGDST